MRFIHDGSETVRDHCYLFTVRDHSVLFATWLYTLFCDYHHFYKLWEEPWMRLRSLRLHEPGAHPLSPAPGCCRSLRAPKARCWVCRGRDFLHCGTAYTHGDPEQCRLRRRSRSPSRVRWWRTTAGKELKTENEEKTGMWVLQELNTWGMLL